MTYPSLPITRNSTAERDGGITTDRATNGLLKTRVLYSADKTTFRIEHLLTADDKATLEAFYQANKTASAYFLWPEDGATYTVRFGSAPVYRQQGAYYLASLTLLEV